MGVPAGVFTGCCVKLSPALTPETLVKAKVADEATPLTAAVTV
jgi:hypothetical protein